jgi:hypothetical protein
MSERLSSFISQNPPLQCRVVAIAGASPLAQHIRRPAVHSIFYRIGLVVVVLVIISLAL